jgi:acyl-coenzyme A synthetase/AMP-(fatty) acid ligase
MFDDIIRFQAATNGDALAVIGRTGNRSFAKFEADIRRAVTLLWPLQVGPRESVSIAVADTYIEWVLVMALARLGIASAARGDGESEYRITDAAGDTAGPGESRQSLLSGDDIAAIESGPDCYQVRVACDREALGHVFRTSGTTDEPKRVGVSWRVLDANVRQVAVTHPDRQGIWFVTTGIATQFGFHYALAAWLLGNPVVVGIGPVADTIVQVKPRLLGLVPAQLQYVIDQLPADHRAWPMRIVSGGSAMPRELAGRIRELFGSDVILNYACTEVAQIAIGTLDDVEREPRSAGYLRPNVELRVLDDDGNEVGDGEIGRLCFRTNRMSLGYLDDPDRTVQCYRDGWFHSNDIGRLRDDGLLLLEGRVDDLMNLGGHKLLPAAIEEAAAQCPGVREVGAFAFRTRSGLDRCGLAIVADDGFDPRELRQRMRGTIAVSQKFEILRCESLPRNEMGKIERQRLREMMERSAAAAE